MKFKNLVLQVSIFIATVGFLASIPAHAEESAGSFGIGVHGGVNLNDLQVNNNSSGTLTANETGTAGGVFGVHLELGNEQFVIRPELNYSTHDYNYAGVVDVSHHYLEIPVLLKVALLPAPISPFVEIGPQFGFHLSDDVTTLASTVTYTDNSNTVNVAAVGGAGLRIDVAQNLGIEAEARYIFGITNDSSGNDVTVKTRGFQILGGVTVRY